MGNAIFLVGRTSIFSFVDTSTGNHSFQIRLTHTDTYAHARMRIHNKLFAIHVLILLCCDNPNRVAFKLTYVFGFKCPA